MGGALRAVVVAGAVAGAVDFSRSYVRRQGQCTRRQKAGLRELWPLYGVDVPGAFGVCGVVCMQSVEAADLEKGKR